MLLENIIGGGGGAGEGAGGARWRRWSGGGCGGCPLATVEQGIGCGGSSAAVELAGEGVGGIEMEGESRSRWRVIEIECPHEYSIFYHIEYEKISSNLKIFMNSKSAHEI